MTDAMPNRRPYVIGWEITSRCNLACPHCYTRPAAGTDPYELNHEECLGQIDALAGLGLEIIGWTGGEPLLRHDLETLSDYALKKYGIKSTVTTNGVLLDEARARSLKESGMAAIQISLDGSTFERNRTFRGADRDEYDKAIKALDICKSLEIKTNLAMLLCRLNLDDAPRMIDLARKHGVWGIRFCGFMPVGGAGRERVRHNMALNGELKKLHDFIEEAREIQEPTVMFDPGFGPIPPDYWFHECVAGVETMYLKANGDLYPCTGLLHDKFLVGNVRERSLKELWNDPAMTVMAQYDRSRLHGECADCANFTNCHGACRGAAFAHTGELDGSIPNCLYRVKEIASDKLL